MNFFVVWRAKAQRRTEIGEDFSDLPKVGKLGTFFYLARKGAEAQRKNPFAASRLRESQFFFLKKTRSLHTVGRLCMNFFVVWRAKAQRRKEKTLGGFATSRESIFFILAKQERRKEIR